MIVKDFDSRGVLTANKLPELHDHGPAQGGAATTRTERTRRPARRRSNADRREGGEWLSHRIAQ
jgi:hypothetical protein